MKLNFWGNLLQNSLYYLQEKTKLDMAYLKRNLVWVNLQLFSVRAIKLVYSVILVRYVSKQFYGEFNYISSVFMLFGFFSLSGFGASVLRALSNHYFGTFKKWLKLGFTWSLAGSLLLVGFGIYNLYLGEVRSYVFILLALIFPFYHLFNRWVVILQSVGKFKKMSGFVISKTIMTSVGNLFLLVIFRKNLIIFVVGSVLLFTLLGIYYHFRSVKHLENDKVEAGWKKSGYKLIFNNLFEYAYNTVDKIIIYKLIGVEAVAIYAIAIIWPENIKTILSNNLLVYFPKIFRISNEQYLKKIKQSLFWIFAISMLALVGSIIIIPLFIKILYGAQYLESVKYATIYAVVIPLHFYQVFTNKALLKINKEEYLSISQVIAGSISIICYLLLVPQMGIMGAVIGSIMFYVVMISMHLVFIRKFKGLKA